MNTPSLQRDSGHRRRGVDQTPWLCAAVLIFAGSAQAQTGAVTTPLTNEEVTEHVAAVTRASEHYQLQLRRSAQSPSGVLQAGRPGEIAVDLSLRGVPAGYDVYGLIALMNESCLVTERISKLVAPSESLSRSFAANFAELNFREFPNTLLNTRSEPVMRIGYADLKGLVLNAGGTLGTGSISLIKGTEQNHPVNLAVPFDIMTILAGGQKNTQDDKWKKMLADNENFPLILNFVYLATAGGGTATENIRNIRVNLLVPAGPMYFNGVLLAPALVKRFGNGFSVLRYEDARANRLVFATTPPPGVEPGGCTWKSPDPAAPQASSGKVIISAPAAPALALGREVSLEFNVRYEGLGPDSELYVLLQAANGSQVVYQDGNATQTTVVPEAKFRWCVEPALGAGSMHIREKPIRTAAPMLGPMEAGLLATIKNGGNGQMNSKITFTPPPFNAYYDRIRATPLIFNWDDAGRLCGLVDTKSSPFIEIKIAGR